MNLLGRYRRLFERAPYASSIALSMLAASLPIGIYTVAILLFVQANGQSIAATGAVAAAFALGLGIGAPIQGRLVDRLGPGRGLVPSAAVHVLAIAGFLWASELGASAAMLVVLAFVGGGAVPRVAPAARVLWRNGLDDDRDLLPVAYALDSMLMESTYLLGPVVVSAFAAAGATGLVIGLAAAVELIATCWFASLPPARRWPAQSRPAGWMGALESAGVRLLLLGALALGLTFGAVDVALVEFAVIEGQPSAAALLITALAIGSVLAALAYGALASERAPREVYLGLLAAAPLTTALLLAGDTVAVMFILALPAGAAIGPLFAAESQLIGALDLASTRTEAFTWMMTATFVGFGVGSALGGALVDRWGWRAAVLASCVVAGAVAALLIHRRQDLELSTQPSAPELGAH